VSARTEIVRRALEALNVGDVEGFVAVLHSRGKGRGSGLELDRHSAMLWRVEESKALSLTFYRDPAAARETARRGSAESG
jgi:ketosteroid isomerase-like protein